MYRPDNNKIQFIIFKISLYMMIDLFRIIKLTLLAKIKVILAITILYLFYFFCVRENIYIKNIFI